MKKEESPFNNPFGSLGELRRQLPEGEKPDTSAVAPVAFNPGRVVIALERKGRRGKEVTLLKPRGLAPSKLESWCAELKQAFGCGGTVEEGTIVLQGDHRARLQALLEPSD